MTSCPRYAKTDVTGNGWAIQWPVLITCVLKTIKTQNRWWQGDSNHVRPAVWVSCCLLCQPVQVRGFRAAICTKARGLASCPLPAGMGTDVTGMHVPASSLAVTVHLHFVSLRLLTSPCSNEWKTSPPQPCETPGYLRRLLRGTGSKQVKQALLMVKIWCSWSLCLQQIVRTCMKIIQGCENNWPQGYQHFTHKQTNKQLILKMI